jgi:hypothetical protein
MYKKKRDKMGKKKETTMDKKNKSERIYLECFVLFIDALETMKNDNLNKECKIQT